MIEKTGNMWDMKADAYCITTNGVVRGNGRAVMGAGVALLAVKRFPECDKFLGDFIAKNGHIVGVFYIADTTDLVSFPTKYHWRDKSHIELIGKSAKELMELIYKNNYNNVVLPRPGCANGGLEWKDVRKVIGSILDDRVVVVAL